MDGWDNGLVRWEERIEHTRVRGEVNKGAVRRRVVDGSVKVAVSFATECHLVQHCLCFIALLCVVV